MMTLMTAVLAALALNANAAGRIDKQIDSTCSFSTSEGAAQITFTVQYLVFDEDRGREEIKVMSTLNSASAECVGRHRLPPACSYADGRALLPDIVSDGPMKDKVARVRLVRRVGDDLQLLGEGSCQ